MYTPTTATIIFIGIFSALYFYMLFKRVVRGLIDLYDFFMLSSLAVVPLLFVLLPTMVTSLTQLLGVAFPFFILFGVIFLMCFLLIYRLIRRNDKLQRDMCRLIQTVGMLESEMYSKNPLSSPKRFE